MKYNSLITKIGPEMMARRQEILKYVYLAKQQLIRAALSGQPYRIQAAKLTLIRHLLELEESPELGDSPPFKWGGQLEVLIRAGYVPGLCWDCCVNHSGSYYAVANYLRSTIQLDHVPEMRSGNAESA